MSNQYYSFYYDPIHLGYGASSWRTLYGDVSVGGGKLKLFNAAILHYADILRGDAYFSLNIPAPAGGADRKFGFIQYNKNAYAYFKISDSVFSANTSDGVTAYSVTIPWQTAWSSTNTVFRIKWETGAVTFFAGGALVATIGYSTLLDVPVSVVPNDPMSLYMQDDTGDTCLLNYIEVKGIQSYLMNAGDVTSTGVPLVFEASKINITENITINIPININKTDNVTVTDTVSKMLLYAYPSVSDSATITDVPSILIPVLPVNVNDQLNITDNFSGTHIKNVNVSDQINITENVMICYFVNVSDQVNITENIAMFSDAYNIPSVSDQINITESVAMEKWTG